MYLWYNDFALEFEGKLIRIEAIDNEQIFIHIF